MNLEQARIVLRARSVSETFDLGLKWLVSVKGPYLRLAFALLVPSWILCLAARWWLQWEWLAVWALAAGIGLLVQGPFTIAASRLMFASDVGVRSVLGQFLRRSGVYVLAMTISRGLVGLTGFAVVLPPLLWPGIAFVPEAVLLEGQGFTEGLKRAWAFNRGQTGTVLALLCGLSAGMFGFVAGFDQLLGLALLEFVLQVGRPFESLWEDGGSAAALLGFFAAIPYLATVRFLHYIDGRTRRDGWDIQLAFLAIAMAEGGAEEEAA